MIDHSTVVAGAGGLRGAGIIHEAVVRIPPFYPYHAV
jgi:hypothetical protein